MKSREWLDRGNRETDPFNALSNYWRGFNNLFAGVGSERGLISTYIQSKVDESFAQKLIDTQSESLQVLVGQPIIDMRGNGRDTSQYIDQFCTRETAVEKLVALFMIIYQVRCNFEHGQKSPSRKTDLDLCRAACPFVAAMVDHTANKPT